MLNRFLDKLDLLARKARPWVPFTALNTVWRMMDKEGKSMLDVGCGTGEPMAFMNRQGRFKVVGIDIFKPYVEESREKSQVLSQLKIWGHRDFGLSTSL